MDITTFTSVLQQLRSKSAVPDGPLVQVKAQGRAHIHADLAVDLEAVVTEARLARAPSLTIYCDTLLVNNIVNIDSQPTSVSVVARRLVAAEHGLIRLAHFDTNDDSQLRMTCRLREGPFRILSASKNSLKDYDLAVLDAPHAVPHYTNFVALRGKPETAVTPVPVGLLADGEPLHRTLTASFALAVSLISEGDDNPELADLAYDILSWLSGWSGLTDDIAQIARYAERLRQLVPLRQDQTRIIPIPDRTAAAWLELAGARQAYARSVEVDEHFLTSTETIADIASAFAQATAKRDTIEVSRIKNEIAALEALEPGLKKARDAAAEAVHEFEFEGKLRQIEMQLAVEKDRIDKIVSASFDIAVALISLGTSIAAICLGVPPDPKGGSTKAINGVEGLLDAVSKNWASTQRDAFDNKLFRAFDNLSLLYSLPVTFVWKNRSNFQDSYTSLLKSGNALKTARSQIMGAGSIGSKLDQSVEALNKALRNLANKPGLIEARSAWEVIELTTVTQLDRIINDSNTAGTVKDAAANYKISVQKMAVYGRAMAEHQAAIDANQREIAARMLQRCAQIGKEAVPSQLAQSFTDRAALDAHIKADLKERREAAARGFFVACYGYRRAQYYETLTLPDTPVALSYNSTDMAQTSASLATDISNATAVRNRREVTFTEEIRLTDQDIMRALAAGQPVTCAISPDSLARESFERLRLTRLELWLDPAVPTSQQVRFDIQSGAGFADRTNRGWLQFVGPVVTVPFGYRGARIETDKTFKDVLPPPFTDWLVTLIGGTADPVEGVTLKLHGVAFK